MKIISMRKRRSGSAIASAAALLLCIACLASCNLYVMKKPLLPGYYIIDKCMYTIPIYNMTISLNLYKIAIYEDFSVELFCNWKSTWTPGAIGYLQKRSDAENTDMYIKDSFGKRYDHVLTTGIAYDNYGFSGADSADGSFIFPPINKDTSSITFYDDDQGKKITIEFD